MWHSELGKSSLEVIRDEEYARIDRNRALTKMATALAQLEQQKLTDAIANNGLEQLYQYFQQAMVETLFRAEFGTYCHEGGSLFSDTLERLGLSWDSFPNGTVCALSRGAESIVYEYEGSQCSFCQDDGGDESSGDSEENGPKSKEITVTEHQTNNPDDERTFFGLLLSPEERRVALAELGEKLLQIRVLEQQAYSNPEYTIPRYNGQAIKNNSTGENDE